MLVSISISSLGHLSNDWVGGCKRNHDCELTADYLQNERHRKQNAELIAKQEKVICDLAALFIIMLINSEHCNAYINRTCMLSIAPSRLLSTLSFA